MSLRNSAQLLRSSRHAAADLTSKPMVFRATDDLLPKFLRLAAKVIAVAGDAHDEVAVPIVSLRGQVSADEFLRCDGLRFVAR